MFVPVLLLFGIVKKREAPAIVTTPEPVFIPVRYQIASS
jgi:hypothetical protein